MTTRQGAAVQLVEHLPIEVLAKLLAEAASGDTPPRYMPDLVSPHFLTGRVGQLMLVCKRFAEAVQTAAFWQQSWVALETTTSLYDPRHAAWLRRLAVNVTTPDGGANHGDTESWGPAPGLTHCYQPMLSGLKQLQLWSSQAAFPLLDLRALSQLEQLEMNPEDNSYVFWVRFPPKTLRELKIECGMLDTNSWHSLSMCRSLQRLDCQVQELPGMRPEALPKLQRLVLGVYNTESVLWAATVARRSVKAQLELYDDPAPLAQPQCHGLQLEMLNITDQESNSEVWQHMQVQRLYASSFIGGHVNGATLPGALEECVLVASEATRTLCVDLSGIDSLQKFRLSVSSKCQLDLHGSFREGPGNRYSTCHKCSHHRSRSVHWLGQKRCRGA